MASDNMQFILVGFRQDRGFRIFGFHGIAPDRSRTTFAVRADITLAQRYEIRLQDLPLLCREYLEHRHVIGAAADSPVVEKPSRAFTYEEEDMRQYASKRLAIKEAALQKKRTHAAAAAAPHPETV